MTASFLCHQQRGGIESLPRRFKEGEDLAYHHIGLLRIEWFHAPKEDDSASQYKKPATAFKRYTGNSVLTGEGKALIGFEERLLIECRQWVKPPMISGGKEE